jgi:hypothetical protein
MKLIQKTIIIFLSLTVFYSGAESVLPYNSQSHINKNMYSFSDDDRLIFKKTVYPLWDFNSIFFKNSSVAQVDFGYSYAKDAFSAKGTPGGSALYWFGENPVIFRNISALSLLIEENQVMYDSGLGPSPIDYGDPSLNTKERAALSTRDHFLRYLAGKGLYFEAETRKQLLSFRYGQSCWDNLFYIGFELSVVSASQNIAMVSVLNRQESLEFVTKQSSIYNTNASTVSGEYPEGISSVFNDLMKQKGFQLDRNDQTILIGDSKIFINFPLKADSQQMGSISAYLIIPSSQQTNTAKPIPAFVGAPYRGQTIGLSTAFVWGYSSFINLNVSSYAQYSFQQLLSRRVPRIVRRIKSGDSSPLITGSDVTLKLPLSLNTLVYRSYADINEPDSMVSYLSDKFFMVNMRYGPEFGVQIGNAFTDLFVKDLQLDLAYKFNFKGNDVIAKTNLDINYDYDADLAVKDSFSVSHSAKINIGYQYTPDVNFFIAGSYVFAGRHCLQDRSINLGISGSF